MGCFGSKDKLSKEDMDFLKSHTRYDEATIKEWYKGFKVSLAGFFGFLGEGVEIYVGCNVRVLMVWFRVWLKIYSCG